MKRLLPTSYSHISYVILLIVLINTTSIAQNQFKESLKIKTNKQLHEIIDASPAITGLTAIDLTSGESFGINEDLVFPQASAIKITILMEVYKQASLKKFALTDLRAIDPHTAVGGSGILKDLPDASSLSIRNLCVLMLILSDNTATNAIIDLVGMNNINATLQSLGFKNTRVQRKMIDTKASGRGDENISSPAEAAKILQLLYKGEFIDKTTSAEILSMIAKKDREGSRLASGIPANVPIVFKPGSLFGVSTEWAIINLKDRPYAVAIMENYKVDGQAKQVVEKVSETLYQYFWRIGNATRYGTYLDPALIK